MTGEVAREVCERTGGVAVIEGSIVNLGSQYALNLRLRNCRTGELLDSDQAQASRKEDVLAVLGGLAKGVRSRVGESLASVEKHSAHDLGQAQATGLLQRAVKLDPGFAMAYAALGLTHEVKDEFDLAAANYNRRYGKGPADVRAVEYESANEHARKAIRPGVSPAGRSGHAIGFVAQPGGVRLPVSQARTVNLRAGRRERAAEAQSVEALWEGPFRNAAAARRTASDAAKRTVPGHGNEAAGRYCPSRFPAAKDATSANRTIRPPQRIYERRWALSIPELAMSRLRAEFEQSDRLARFENLKGFLIVSSEVPYAELAEGLDSPVQEALPEAVPAEVDEELRFLARALSPKGNTFT